jgi:RimK-like ATP-grasp domain
MILVCGAADDQQVALVLTALQMAGHPYQLLDLTRYPSGYTIRWTAEDGPSRGVLSGPEWQLELEHLSGVYVRYAGSAPAGSNAADLPPALQEAAAVETLAGLMVILEQLTCRVVNRYHAGLANSSKPYQSLAIRASGFHVPRSLVTTDPMTAEQFFDAYRGEVVIKPIGGQPAIVRTCARQDLERLRSVQPRVPIYLQSFVPGDNIRVHVVGNQAIATLCRSNVVDYRNAAAQGGETQLQPTRLPETVEAACRRLADASGLALTGIDLKRTPEGEYYCFEVNPSPVFSWYEARTDQPISSAVVNLLATSA